MMRSKIYYINDLGFEIPEGNDYKTYYADVKVYKSTYVFGDDADGNRGTKVTDREAEILEVRGSSGEVVKDKPYMWEEIQRIVNERGAELE